jgi:hypothetical protein
LRIALVDYLRKPALLLFDFALLAARMHGLFLLRFFSRRRPLPTVSFSSGASAAISLATVASIPLGGPAGNTLGITVAPAAAVVADGATRVGAVVEFVPTATRITTSAVEALALLLTITTVAVIVAERTRAAFAIPIPITITFAIALSVTVAILPPFTDRR